MSHCPTPGCNYPEGDCAGVCTLTYHRAKGAAMHAIGMLFMSRTPPRFVRDHKGEPQLTLHLVHRIGHHQTEPWTVTWRGQAAQDFWTAHSTALHPGAALQLTVEKLRTHCVGMGPLTEVHADVLACALVPSRAVEGAAA